MAQFTIVGANPYFKESNGKAMLAINVQGRKDPLHVSQKQMLHRGFQQQELYNLAGCTINATFFKEGEELLNGEPCTAGNMIIKDFSIGLSMNLSIARQVAGQIAASMGFGVPAAAPVAAPVAATTTDGVDTETGELTEDEYAAQMAAIAVAEGAEGAEGDVETAEAEATEG